jgi:hypothetical protein
VPWPFNLLVTQFNKQTLFAIGVLAIGAFIAWELMDAMGYSSKGKRAPDRRTDPQG